MTRKRIPEKIVDTLTHETEMTGTKASHPMVFISHDTRDAELAEEFGNLLHRVEYQY